MFTHARSLLPKLASKRKIAALVLATTVGFGTGLSLAQAETEPGRDRYGDPLPPGAIARLGTLRFRVPGEIVTLALAADGKRVAVASYGGLFLFDAVRGKRLRCLPLPESPWEGRKNPFVFSPDGKRLIGLGDRIAGKYHYFGAVVRIWDLDGEKQTHQHDIGQHILWVGWSEKNEPLAICVDDKGALHLHELSAGQSRRFACDKPFKYPSGAISRDPPLAFAPNGQSLAVVDEEHAIHVWDTVSGRERCRFQPEELKGTTVYSLTFSPDGARLATRTIKGVQMWDAAKGKIIHTVAVRENTGPPLFSLDGKTLALADSPRMIRFLDAATGTERSRIQDSDGITAGVGKFALSADGKWLATSTYHGSTFRVWNVASGQRKHEPAGHLGRPHSIAFAPDGRRAATGGNLDGSICIWDLQSAELLHRIRRFPLWVRDVAFSADGRSLFSTWTDDELWISDAASGEKRQVIKLEDAERPDTRQSAFSMRQSGDGKRLVVLSYYHPKDKGGRQRMGDGLITGWDASTHKQLFHRRRPGTSSNVALSRDGRVLAGLYPPMDEKARMQREIARAKGMAIRDTIRLEDVETGEPLLTIATNEGPSWPMAFSPDGRLLVVSNFNNKRSDKDGQNRSMAELWETATAAVVLSFPAADDKRIAFSVDGRLLALSIPDRQILVYDLTRQRERRRFKGIDAEVTDLAFSPGGRRLISGLTDSTLLVWDLGLPDSSTSKLGAEGVAKAWNELGGNDAPRAFRARAALAAAPEETLKYFADRLNPIRAADPQLLRRLLADLDSEQFSVREKAQEELAKLGDLAEPALRQKLADKPTLEERRRVQAVLERLRGPVTRPELLQSLRAVAVLEDIGTREAGRLLEELAKGAPEARLTREVKKSLRRLDLLNSSAR